MDGVCISPVFPGIQSLGQHFCTDTLRILTSKKTGLMNEITVIFCFQTLLSFVPLGILLEGKLQETYFLCVCLVVSWGSELGEDG